MIFLPILTVLAAIGGIKAFSPGYLLAPLRKKINRYKIFYPVTECDLCGAGSFYNILTVLIAWFVMERYDPILIPFVIILNGLVSMGLMTVLNKHL